MKCCSKCKTEKSEKEFYVRKESPDGFRNDCKTCHNARTTAYYAKNKEHICATVNAERRNNPHPFRQRDRMRRQNNPERFRERARAKFQRTKEAIRQRKLLRRQTDLSYRLLCNLRSRVGLCIRRNSGKKAKETIRLLGCSIKDFLLYIESKWEPGMCWENYGKGVGKWAIDHIMPCAIFDFTKSEHQRRCFHFSNHQPLWFVDNSAKHDKVLSNQFNLL